MSTPGGDMITGEAVLVDIRPATFASRAVSGLIDVAIEFAALLTVLIVSLNLSLGLDDAAAAALGLLIFVAITVGVPATVETLTRGRTLGKLVMGLRAVRDDGGPVRLRHALVRALVGVIEVWMLWGVPALLCSLLSPRSQRLGDLAAGTYVVRERGARESAPIALMPPRLAGWARATDIGRLPDGLALAARQFLGRAAGMHQASRASMGRQLASAVGAHVAPLPPPGTHPEEFLTAVLAERRRRDLERLAREQQLRDRLARADSVEAALTRVRQS